MLEIILNTPIYIWPLLAYILFVGIKALKTRQVPLSKLVIVPVLFAVWSSYSLFARYGMDSSIASSWSLKMGLGIFLGYLTMNKISLKFDKEKKLVELPGTLHSLIAPLLLFSVRYSLGVLYTLHPDWQGHSTLLAFEGIATVISASFVGRLLNILKRYRAASDEKLA